MNGFRAACAIDVTPFRCFPNCTADYAPSNFTWRAFYWTLLKRPIQSPR